MDTDKCIEEVIAGVVASGKAKAGDPIIIIHGTSAMKGSTNTMRIEYA